jgi:hypothetical protein
VGRFLAWLRESASILGRRRTSVTVALSAVAAGVAVWWSLGGLPIVVQALSGVVITGGMSVFFLWVVGGWLVPEAMLVTGAGLPFDDPEYATTTELGYAKKIRVRAMTSERLEACRVTMTDAPGGAITLGWLPDGGEEFSLPPGDEHHYVLFPTGILPVGDRVVHLELTHARSAEPVRWRAQVRVERAEFPTIVLQR